MGKRGNVATNIDSEPAYQRRKDARPGEIIDAALIEFAEKGFARTKLEDVAKGAGVSKGTIYHYFDDKHGLFEALVRAKLLESLSDFDPFLQSLDGPVSDFIGFALKQAYSQGKSSGLTGLMKVLILEGDQFKPLLESCLSGLIGQSSSLISGAIEIGIERGELIDSPYCKEPFALIFPILCATVLYEHLDQFGGFDVDRFIDIQIELSLSSMQSTKIS